LTSAHAASPASDSAAQYDDDIPMGTPVEDEEKEPDAPLHATLDMALPTELRPPPLEATQVIEHRPSRRGEDDIDATLDDPGQAPPAARRPASAEMQLDATMAVAGYRIQPERRASARASGQLLVAVPDKPEAPARKLGEILIEAGKLTHDQLQEALELAQASGQKLGRVLLSAGAVTPDALCRAVSMQLNLPMTVLDGDTIPERLRTIFPLAMMMHHNFVPFDDAGAQLCIATSNPLDAATVKDLEKISKRFIQIFIARDDQVGRQLDWMRVKMKTRSRRYLRFEFRQPASYQFSNRAGVRVNRDVYEGTTLNISEGGCLLDSPQPHHADPAELLRRGFFINLSVKTEAGAVWAVGEVREIRLGGGDAGPRWMMGVEFIDISPENRTLLKDVLRNAAQTRRPKSRRVNTPLPVPAEPAAEQALDE
jgi:hypothetical protein